jgi:glutamine synthetase
LHLHQSVIDVESGRNIFSDEKEQPTDLFFSFIGGLQKYIPESILLLAPYVNSYRRFARYLSAPINVQWGYENRTVGFRVPRSDPEARRVENRVPGADVNPYIAIATSLACGYLGMLEGLSPSEAVDTSAYDMEHAMPRDLFSALDCLKECKEIQEILGEKFIEVFCAVKEQEHETFFQVISPWEREFLLLNV